MKETYLTIRDPQRAETKVKGSRFIAEAFPVETEAAAEARIEEIRKREHAATHHCTAYRLGIEGDVFRYDDDGEPSGTAGPPILRQVEGRDLTDTLVVVTRYYGGTKLGTGGLIRAYGDAASDVLDRCTVVKHVVRLPVRVRFAYDDTSPALHTLDRFGAEIRATTYTEETEIVAAVRPSQVESFLEAFTDALSGRGNAHRVED